MWKLIIDYNLQSPNLGNIYKLRCSINESSSNFRSFITKRARPLAEDRNVGERSKKFPRVTTRAAELADGTDGNGKSRGAAGAGGGACRAFACTGLYAVRRLCARERCTLVPRTRRTLRHTPIFFLSADV